MLTPETWSRRYADALSIDVIRRRAERRGKPAEGLDGMPLEQAIIALHRLLEDVVLITGQSLEIILSEVGRALAHAKLLYTDPYAPLRAGYECDESAPIYVPTVLTGPAGGGKSVLRMIIGRLLSGSTFVRIDDQHRSVPMIDYIQATVGNHRSVGGVLRQLAGPEIRAGHAKIPESHLPDECRRWLHLSGVCLFSIDEAQKLTQSSKASTLATRLLLASQDIRVPWMVIANYSLFSKLVTRPAEAVQRLLGRPRLLLPDTADSVDWKNLLLEYAKVLKNVCRFSLIKKGNHLWAYCAGIKRLLRILLVEAYTNSRLRGAKRMVWADVEAAYASKSYRFFRRQVEALIAHASQGEPLGDDLLCPFPDALTGDAGAAYAEGLRGERQARVSKAQVEAAMMAKERAGIALLKKDYSTTVGSNGSKAGRKKRSAKHSLQSLQEAGRRTVDKLGVRSRNKA